MSDKDCVEPSAAQADAARKPRHWGRKMALFFVSLFLTFGLLEGVARLIMPGRAPVLISSGFYDNPLPLVTSTTGPPIPLDSLPGGTRMPEAKRDGEIRIFVMGESSVAGSPFQLDLSPPAMLKHQLDRRLPGRDFTVVGMGRPGSITTNVWYYLLYLRRFSPDYVVFFMGMNDNDMKSGETCMLGTRPITYGIWQFLVSRSWMAWLARAYGPNLLWSMTKRTDWYPPSDCEVSTFAAWTDLLIRVTVDIGAQPIVVTPVLSAAVGLEPEYRGDDLSDRPVDPVYRDLLACFLTEGCRFPARLRAVLEVEGPPQCRNPEGDSVAMCSKWLEQNGNLLRAHELQIARVAKAWEDAVAHWGGQYVPFHRLLEEASEEGLLAADFFTDRQHLTPAGYWWVASLAAERVVADQEGRPAGPVPVPGEADVEELVKNSPSVGFVVELEQLARGWYLTGALGVAYSARVFVPGICASDKVCAEAEDARVALGWLRQKAGLEHGLPPELARRVADFDPRRRLEELRRSR